MNDLGTLDSEHAEVSSAINQEINLAMWNKIFANDENENLKKLAQAVKQNLDRQIEERLHAIKNLKRVLIPVNVEAIDESNRRIKELQAERKTIDQIFRKYQSEIRQRMDIAFRKL